MLRRRRSVVPGVQDHGKENDGVEKSAKTNKDRSKSKMLSKVKLVSRYRIIFFFQTH